MVISRSPAAADAPLPTLSPLDPRVRLRWWCEGALSVLPMVLFAGVVDGFGLLPVPRGLLLGGVAALCGGAVAVLPLLRYRRWRYALLLDESDPATPPGGALWLRRGVVWETVSVIPLVRLQFVDTQQGPLDRLFGLAQLVVHTAALGTSGRLPGLDAAEAERLRGRLAAVQPDATV